MNGFRKKVNEYYKDMTLHAIIGICNYWKSIITSW